MSVQGLNTLHSVPLERNQLPTIFAMSVQSPQLAGFLLTRNCSNFLTSKAPLLGFTIIHIFSLLYTKLIDVSIVYQYILKTLLCMSTQLQDKFMTMLLLSHVIINLETVLN